LLKLGNIVIKNGIAIGIGHVGAEGGLATAQAIKSVYPILNKKGIEFIYVSDLVKLKNKS